jgi:diguanylate cyclase (GGDEF)-like protein
MSDTPDAGTAISCNAGALLACVEVGKTLTSTYDLKEILALIMEKISELIRARNWSLLLKDEVTGELAFDIAVGIDRQRLSGLRIARGGGIAGRVAESGEMAIVTDAQAAPGFNHVIDRLTGFRTKNLVCLPLKSHGKVLGVVEIVNVADIEAFRSAGLPILNILADYAAVAIENSRFFEKIQRMSITDEYTGLYNARYMHQILEEMVAKALVSGREMTAVFMDVDNFKTVVDTHGHLSGSRVLREVGEVISSHLGKDDTLIKYGGDEFVILLPGRGKQEALERIEVVAAALRGTAFLVAEGKAVRVTASFGMASCPQDAATKKDLLLMADQAMYRVKRSTKNGVAVS